MPNLKDKKTIYAHLTKSQLQARITAYSNDIAHLEQGTGTVANAVLGTATLLAGLGGWVFAGVITLANFIYLESVRATIDRHKGHRTVFRNAVSTLDNDSTMLSVRISQTYEYLETNPNNGTRQWVPLGNPWISGYKFKDGREVIQN